MIRGIGITQDDELISPEVREPTARMVGVRQAKVRSEWEVMISISP